LNFFINRNEGNGQQIRVKNELIFNCMFFKNEQYLFKLVKRIFIGGLMNYLFDDDRKKDSYEVETLKDSIRRIKNNLDMIYREIEEIERRLSNQNELFEVRRDDYDDFVKNAINKKRPARLDKDVSFEADDAFKSDDSSDDFTKKLELYDE